MVRKNRKHGRTTRVAFTRQLTINFVHASLVLPIQGNPVLKDLLDLQHFRQQVERQAELETGIQAACLDWTEVAVTPPCKNMLFDGWKNAAEDTSSPPRVTIGLKGPTTPPLNVDRTPPPRSAPTEPERALTMEGGVNNDQVSALVAKVTVLFKELKADIAAQNDKILAQDDAIKELKANMAAQNDTINVLKANMAAQNDTINELKADIAAQNDKIIAQDDTINELKDSINELKDSIKELKANMAARYLSRGATIEKLEAEILAQGGIIKTLEAANMDIRRKHTQEIDQLNTRLTESNEELAEKLTAHSAEIEKLQNDNKQQQKCIRVLMLTFATSSAENGWRTTSR